MTRAQADRVQRELERQQVVAVTIQAPPGSEANPSTRTEFIVKLPAQPMDVTKLVMGLLLLGVRVKHSGEEWELDIAPEPLPAPDFVEGAVAEPENVVLPGFSPTGGGWGGTFRFG